MKHWLQQNFWSFFFGIFAFIGTLTGIAFFYLTYRQYDLRSNGVQTSAVVIDMVYNGEGGGSPTVSFVAENGETIRHNSNLSTKPPEYEVGDPVTVWYDPADPHRLVMSDTGSWLGPLITGLFFLIFGGIGYGGLLNRFFSKRRKKQLLESGKAVNALVSEVRYNTSLRVNGASPYVVVAQWLDDATNKLYVFESENIWFNPDEFVRGRTVRVMIDPSDPSKYTMDMSFLPEQGN